MSLDGIGGTLFPQRYLATSLEGDLPAFVSTERTAAARRQLVRWWTKVEAACGPATGLRTLFDLTALPLTSLLGFHASAVEFEESHAHACLETPRGAVVALLLHPWSSRCPSTWREVVRAARDLDASWCVLMAPPHVSLVDARGRAARRSLDLTFPEALAPESLARWWWLLQASAFEPGRQAVPRDRSATRIITPLDSLLECAAEHQSAVGADLQRGVERALAALLGAVTPRTSVAELTGLDEALTVVYRILFLLFAESRDLVPRRHPIYERSYSLATLCREATAQADLPGSFEGLAALSRLARRGCAVDDLIVPAFNGRLFARRSAPALESRPGRAQSRVRQRDRAVRHALVALGTRSGPAGLEEIAYADLGVEELGAVYERVLDLDPSALAPGNAARPKTAAVHPHSRRRKESGTFYTPRALTEFVVRRTLEPLVAGRTADGILALRVLDPAMGSGAFLVAACRFLAGAYERALIDEGQLGEADVDDDQRARLRRLVAERCLAGVDENTTAAELARLSVWLTTLARGKPLGFVDHRLRVGNSLLGASPDDLWRIPAGRRTTTPREIPLFPADDLGDAVSRLARPFLQLVMQHDDSVADVHAKERLWTDISGPRSPVAQWRRACSVWCLQWLWPNETPPSAAELRAAIDALIRRDGTLPRVRLEHIIRVAEAVQRRWQLFHWPLEFPDVFYEPDGSPRADGGFDAVVGNPPWEMLRHDPRAEGSHPDGTPEPGGFSRRELMARFIRRSGIYHLASRGHLNLYQPFLERSLALVRRGGRVGLVMPWGLASDDGAADLREQLLDRHTLDTLVGLDNGRALFPIHRGLRFLVAVARKGTPTEVVRARFSVQSSQELDSLPGRDDPLDTAYPVRLTRRLLQVTGGSRRRLPDARRPQDLALADRLMRELPALGDANGWALAFGRELNITDDRGLFSREGLPVIEGKHVTPFEVDASSARHRIPRSVAERALGHDRVARPRLAYRDISGTANRLSLIAAVVPAGVVTSHTLFCLRTPVPREQLHFLAALLNSFVLNAFVRLFMGQHVTTGLVEDLPAPLWTGSAEQRRIAGLSQMLSEGGAPEGVEVEVHAAVARLFRLDAEAFLDLMAGFPLVPATLGRAVAALLPGRRVAL